MKMCNKCGRLKDLKEFSKQNNRKGGFRNDCKSCCSEYIKEYKNTFYGWLTKVYGHQKSSSKDRKHPLPNYTKKELGDWVLNQLDFGELWNNWVYNDYLTNLIPSLDRLDDCKPYTFSNIQIITWAENRSKGHIKNSRGVNNTLSKAVLQLDLEDNLIKEYYSISEASRITSVSKGNISKCCSGYRKTAGGFIWKFDVD